jgi:amidophosphoribosyltransferase
MFERVYFSRPSSTIDGDNIYLKRLNLGRELAYELKEQHPSIVERIDRIAPVPDTSRPIALNLARKLDKPYIEVFDKNRYSGRSFIEPNQEQRRSTIKSKLSPIKSEINGFSIGIVDDSVVRGNTSKIIVNILKDAGAKEVHFLVGSSPLKYPCHLGIDLSTNGEYIAHEKGMDEIRDYIGADSLTYLSYDGLRRAIGGNDYCYGCVTGEYPVELSQSFSKARSREKNGMNG